MAALALFCGVNGFEVGPLTELGNMGHRRWTSTKHMDRWTDGWMEKALPP